jgi:hypothetical protein
MTYNVIMSISSAIQMNKLKLKAHSCRIAGASHVKELLFTLHTVKTVIKARVYII